MARPNNFQDAFDADAAQPEPATPALDAKEDATDPQDGDLKCPCCGASAMKIVQAAQGASAPMAGGMGDMGGMK